MNVIVFLLCHMFLQASCFEETLRQIHILYRHGDRAPVTFYENDPYKSEEEKYWPEGLGELTKKGKAMEYHLGRWLRNRYGNFIGSIFDSDEVHITSTDYDRTLMSAQCVLAAFYSPGKDEVFMKNVSWLPTPVHTSPAGKDFILNVDQTCPQIDNAVKRMQATPFVSNFTKSRQAFFANVSFHAGDDRRDYKNVCFLYDTAFIEKNLGLELPHWLLEYYDKLKEVSEFCFKLIAYTKELQRLRFGPLLLQMTSNMKNVEFKETTKKMFMYSAHDTTVAGFLNTLGAYNNKSPPYAATVVVELHNSNSSYYIKVFYHNDSSIEPHLLQVEGCNTLCQLKDWQTVLSDRIPDDWEGECGIKKSSLLFQGLACAFLLMILFAGIYMCYRRRSAVTRIDYQPLST